MSVCQQSGLRVIEILRGSSLCITQCMDDERRCAEFVRELLDLRDRMLQVDILSQNEVLELIQITVLCDLVILVIPGYI